MEKLCVNPYFPDIRKAVRKIYITDNKYKTDILVG